MNSRHRLVAALVTALVGAVALTACAGGDWTDERPVAAPIGTLRPGFAPVATPSPEATIVPAPGSWADVHPAPGYRVVLLTSGSDSQTATLATAVREWAGDEKVDLRTVEAEDDPVSAVVSAIDLNPDLIISAGNDLIDPLATVTASHLDQRFLVVGAEVAEPTYNVTAVDWTGASFRGEGLGASSTYDPASFTPERSGKAVRAGVAAVLNDLTGIVLWID